MPCSVQLWWLSLCIHGREWLGMLASVIVILATIIIAAFAFRGAGVSAAERDCIRSGGVIMVRTYPVESTVHKVCAHSDNAVGMYHHDPLP